MSVLFCWGWPEAPAAGGRSLESRATCCGFGSGGGVYLRAPIYFQ
jgi:hypothetical protein